MEAPGLLRSRAEMVEPHFPIGGRTSHWERDRVGKSECGSRGQGKGRNLSLPRRPHLVESQGRLFLVDGALLGVHRSALDV
jgi:hypothetical protein